MAYVILRTEKCKTRNTIAGLIGHHLRIPGSKLDNVDLSRSHLNVVIGAHDRGSFNKAVRERIATCTRKPRPDANKVVEMMLGASPEFFEGKSYEEQKAYLHDCLDFAKGFFGEANIVGAYMHFDESTPHISILAVPIETSVRKTKKMEREVTTLNASHFFGGKEAMIQMQTDVALFVQARGHDLLRGEPKAETSREHEPLGSYWKNQAKTIDAAVVAAADHLDDAAIQSRVASELLAIALDEAQRTGVEVEAMAVQRAALDTEHAALVALRGVISAQGRGVDQEWKKLRERALDYETREKQMALKESQASAALFRVLEKEERLLDSLTELETRQWDVSTAEEVAQLVKRPELLGMLDFLAQREDARDLLALMKVDPVMAEAVKQNIAVAVGLGSDLKAADWGKAGAGVDWVRVARAAESVPLPDGFGESSDGPYGP